MARRLMSLPNAIRSGVLCAVGVRGGDEDLDTSHVTAFSSARSTANPEMYGVVSSNFCSKENCIGAACPLKHKVRLGLSPRMKLLRVRRNSRKAYGNCSEPLRHSFAIGDESNYTFSSIGEDLRLTSSSSSFIETLPGISDVRSTLISRRVGTLEDRANKLAEETLSKAYFLQGCDPLLICELRSHLVSQEFAPGEEIIRQGDNGAMMYLLRRGEVEVLVDNTPVAKLPQGVIFGEMCLLPGAGAYCKRSSSVKALLSCECLTLGRYEFAATLDHFPRDKQRIGVETRKRIKAQLDSNRAKVDDQVQLKAALAEAALRDRDRRQAAEERRTLILERTRPSGHPGGVERLRYRPLVGTICPA